MTNKPQTYELKFHIINMLLVTAATLTLFILFTNLLPLVQAGWIKSLGKKTRYVNLMAAAVSIFTALMILVRWKTPTLFDRTWPVLVWKKLCRLHPALTASIFFLLYTAVMTWTGFERQEALETRAFDLGIFVQAVWNTLHGDFLFSSIKENINLLGDHVSPILALLTPAYALWPDPKALILIQAIAAASCMFPLAYLAQERLKDRFWAVIFVLMYFFYQPTRAALHEDFHPEVLIETFLILAFIFLEHRKKLPFLLSLLVAVSAKENILGIAFMLGFYALVWKRMPALGISVMVASVGLFLFETRWLIPFLTHEKYFYGGNYAVIMTNPISGIFQKLLGPEQLSYIFKCFLPFLFLPFFHLPTLILTFPVLFQNLLSQNTMMRSFNHHYLTGMTPFLFISTIYAVNSLSLKFQWVQKNIRWLGLALLFAGIIRSGPSEYYYFSQSRSHRNAHTEMVKNKLRQIPGDQTVLTHNNLIPQLINRKSIYQFSYNSDPTKMRQADHYQADYVIFEKTFWEPNTLSIEETLRDFQAAGFAVEFSEDGFYILKRGTS